MLASTRFSNGAGSPPLRVALLACWGIGLEMLETLNGDGRVRLTAVLTRMPREGDYWAGAVFERAGQLGLPAAAFEGLGEAGLLMALGYADLLVVHAYPRKLPRTVFGAPRLGTVNVHPSLLPRYRGQAPTRAALADGAEETGLTAHYMDDDYDTGAVIAQERIFVSEDDTEDTVIEHLKAVVPALMRETITRVMDPLFEPAPQTRVG
ncbi:MAG TPA: formyltransferase family protein [Pseudodesulfovibrio sp.]|nr:formyltransferase family protein [Pseudodesulfovibrio sp.]